MRVLVTGASGFIGGAVCAQLAASKHAVSALSRRPEATRRRAPGLEQVLPWDPLSATAPVEAVERIDAVVHLAGESVAGRWTAAKRQAIRDSRVVGTRQLVAAMRAAVHPPRVLICSSAVGYYGDRGDEELREQSAPGTDFLASVCQQWEAEADQAHAVGIRVVRLRTGIVLGPGGGALGAMLTPFRLGAGGPLGSGQQWWSWIHRDDLVGMIAAAVGNDAWTGAVNATAPEPVRQRAFAEALGHALHRPAFVPAPAVALKLLLGGFSAELLGSKRVLPARAQALGYPFQHAQLAAALAAVVSPRA